MTTSQVLALVVVGSVVISSLVWFVAWRKECAKINKVVDIDSEAEAINEYIEALNAADDDLVAIGEYGVHSYDEPGPRAVIAKYERRFPGFRRKAIVAAGLGWIFNKDDKASDKN